MCGGTGSLLGAALGYLLAPATGGASLALAMGAGAAAGDAMVDKPQQQAKDAAAAQQTAAEQATKSAERQADLAYNSAQRGQSKTPDVGSMLAGNQQAAKGGGSGTMLTGPGGVDPTTLNLGKNTLLGS